MSDQKTEQPTPRRREKAREQGQVARSRELSSAMAIIAAVLFLGWKAPDDVIAWRAAWRAALNLSIGTLHVPGLLQTTSMHALVWLAPTMLVAWGVALIASFAQGGFTWSPSAPSFRFDRINPASRIKQLISITAISSMLRSLVPSVVILYLTCGVIAREWNQFVFSTFRSHTSLIVWLISLLFEIAWKSGLVMLAWSVADFLLIRYRIEGDLKMTKEELRRESRENEGDPLVKSRLRRLQHQARRRQMLRDVRRATAVVTNPTHYAIALAYTSDTPAPVVVAKGRDRLAQEIKNVASWNDIPMVENPPLAHALYRAVSVGAAIPPRLYVAVAEVLAFVYRIQGIQPEERNT
jgi:flagellar biosynthetic protein FlhB